MKICKNKSSGKYFICTGYTGNDEALFVTPEGKIKSLKLHLFEALEEKDKDYLLSTGMVTENQLERWIQYQKDRSEERIESLVMLAEQLSPYERKQLIKKLEKDRNDEKELKEQNDQNEYRD